MSTPSRAGLSAVPLTSRSQDAVAALRRRVLELERQSALDRITGLWTRSHFDRIAGREIAFSESQHAPLSLVLIGADPLPKHGADPGQAAGEAVLHALAARLVDMSRPADLQFRWGAAELGLLAPATAAAAAKSLAERVRASLSGLSLPAVGPLAISVGAGEHHAGEDREPWVGRVTAALQAARAAGGNRVALAPGGASALWSAQPPSSALRLVWSEELVSGHELIDTQHGALFDAANTLLAGMTDDRVGTPAILEQLDCLLSALARHFNDEEILLAEVAYPDLPRHRRMHARLLEGARRLRGSLQGGGVTAGQVVEFLAYDVINRHILREDRQYFPFLVAQRAAAR